MASHQDRGAVGHSSSYRPLARPPSTEMQQPRWDPASRRYIYGQPTPQFDAPLRPSSRSPLPSLGSTIAPPPGFQHPHAHSYTAYQHLGPFGDTRSIVQSRGSPFTALKATRGAYASAGVVRPVHIGSSTPLPRSNTSSTNPHQPIHMLRPPISTARPAPSSAEASRVSNQSLREVEVTPVMWDDEGVLCYTIVVGNNVIGRRFDNDWVNCTKAMNILGLSRGKRDGLLKHEEQRLVIRRGSKQLKGVWLPLDRARALAQAQGISNSLYPLLEDDVEPFLYKPNNRAQTRQVVETFARLRSSRDVQALKLTNETDQQHAVRLRKMGVLKRMVAEVETKLEATRGSTKRSSFVSNRKTEVSEPLNAPAPDHGLEKAEPTRRLSWAPTSLPAASSSQGAYFHPPPPPRIQYGKASPAIPPIQTLVQTSTAPTPYRPQDSPLAPHDAPFAYLDEIDPFIFYDNAPPQGQDFDIGSRRASMASEMSIADGDGAPLGFDVQVFSKVPLPPRRHSFPQLEYTPRFDFPFDQHQLDEEARQPSPQSLERASRKSIDAAAAFLFPGVGLGPTSIVAPSTVLYAPDPSFAHPTQPQPLPPPTLDTRQSVSLAYPTPISSTTTTIAFPPYSPIADWNAVDQTAASNRSPLRPQDPHHLLRPPTFSPDHEQIAEGVHLETPTVEFSASSPASSPPPLPAGFDHSFSFPAVPASLPSAPKAPGQQGATGAGAEMTRSSSTVGITLFSPSPSSGSVTGGRTSEEGATISAEQVEVGDAGTGGGGKKGGKRVFDWIVDTGDQKRPKLGGRRASVAW